MDAGLASVSKKDACALIVNFSCLTAPEFSKLVYIPRKGTKAASCKVIAVDRDLA